MFVINENDLFQKVSEQIKFTELLKTLPNINNLIVNQAIKESSLFIYATRYEKHINDMSLGLFQLLTSTIKGMDFNNSMAEMFEVDNQVKYALTYLDYLYSRFGEIKNVNERCKITFSAYNCGIGNINKALKFGRQEEEINYEGENTIQGKWSTYEGVTKMFEKYKIISERNIEINQRYVDFIMNRGR
jgi:hypothetical protein